MTDTHDFQSPPVGLTYWNPSNEHPHTGADWFSYLRGPLLAKYAATSVGLYVQRSTTQQVQAIDSVGSKICGSLYVGFSKLESQLEDVSGRLEDVSNALQTIDGRLTLFADSDDSGHLFQSISDTVPGLSDSCRSEATL